MQLKHECLTGGGVTEGRATLGVREPILVGGLVVGRVRRADGLILSLSGELDLATSVDTADSLGRAEVQATEVAAGG
jgi:hypothetical protein